MDNETKEIIEELFDSLLQKYQNGLDKKKLEEVNLLLTGLIYCIISFMK